MSDLTTVAALKQFLLPGSAQEGMDLEVPYWLVRDAVSALEDRDDLLKAAGEIESKVRLLAVESVRVSRETRNLKDKLHRLLAEIQEALAPTGELK